MGDAATTTPTEICGYMVDCALNADQTYLAIGPGGRGVVLKRLDADCLLRGLLHPSVRERLARVRELAHGGVANLHGVGRDGADAWLIWEYLPGTRFDEHLASAGRGPRDLLLLARELILAIDALHARGIVHGAVTAGNVIVGPDNAVRLTHVSPLLYTDPAADVESVLALLAQVLEQRGELDAPAGQLLASASHDPAGLRALGGRLAALLDTSGSSDPPEPQTHERSARRRALAGAVLLIMIGLAIALSVWRTIEGGPDFRSIFRWVPGTGTR